MKLIDLYEAGSRYSLDEPIDMEFIEDLSTKEKKDFLKQYFGSLQHRINEVYADVWDEINNGTYIVKRKPKKFVHMVRIYSDNFYVLPGPNAEKFIRLLTRLSNWISVHNQKDATMRIVNNELNKERFNRQKQDVSGGKNTSSLGVTEVTFADGIVAKKIPHSKVVDTLSKKKIDPPSASSVFSSNVEVWEFPLVKAFDIKEPSKFWLLISKNQVINGFTVWPDHLHKNALENGHINSFANHFKMTRHPRGAYDKWSLKDKDHWPNEDWQRKKFFVKIVGKK